MKAVQLKEKDYIKDNLRIKEEVQQTDSRKINNSHSSTNDLKSESFLKKYWKIALVILI